MKLLIQSIAAAFTLFSSTELYSQTTVSLSPSADAQVYSNAASTNYGSLAKADVWVDATPTKYYRYYLNFNIAGLSIPSDAIIYSAELTLKPTSTGEGGAGTSSFVLQSARDPWTETGLTFSNQPAAISTNQVTTTSLISGRRVFDVKAIVQSIVNGTATNNGWQIRRNPETTNTLACQYNTREATSADQPQLNITYYRPMSITAATITHASNSAASDGSIVPTITNGSGSFTYQWTNSAGSVVGTGASITGRSPGWYGLRVTGQYGDVYYMAFIVGALCETVNITFNPGPNFMDDALISSLASSADVPNGSGTTIEASSQQSGSWYESRSLLRFRLWFDPAMTPTKALLHLTGSSHTQSGRSNDAVLLQVTQNWNETTVTYNNQPTNSSTISADVPATPGSTDSKDIDLLAFWNYWRQNNTLNYGMLLKLDSYATLLARQQYHSSDAATTANRPYISFSIDHASCDRTSHTVFKSELDAGYARTFQGKLKVRFTEEYNQASGKKPQLILYNIDRQLIASVKYDGTAFSGTTLITVPNYEFDDNNATLNFSTLGLTVNQYYILELTKSTGEKEFIKFVYIN